MRYGITMLEQQGVSLYGPMLGTALARVEAEASQFEAALATIDRAIAATERSGQRWYEAETHRVRGEILLKRAAANTASAEEAFLTAIAIAQQQNARSFELCAALSLAKLYQSTGWAADAHAVLAPALEGFSPTPEFPEIAEAQTILAALAETDEVKNAAASRQRRLQLQTSYGQALLWSRGFAATETRAAFTRARELAAGAGNAAELFPTYYGLWISSITRGQIRLGRETAEIFLHEAKAAGRMTETAVACRILGMTCFWQGHFLEERTHLEEALKIYEPERDRDANLRFGLDTGVCATIYLAQANWLLGDIGRARELIEDGDARAAELAHVTTQTNAYFFKAIFEILCGDAAAAHRAAGTVVELSREHGLSLYETYGTVYLSWARALLGDLETGVTELRAAVAAYKDQGNILYVPFFQGLLAEIEAEGQETEGALALIDAALALAGETGERWTDAFLHRIRGEIVLKRDPVNTAPAEEAFLTAIAIAQEQKAPSFELRASLSLARLWRDQGKGKKARELLAQVYGWFTEGFDTLDLKEAKVLLNELHA